MEGAWTPPSVTVAGKTVLHTKLKWRVCTNRHPNTDGTPWGWIEGPLGSTYWSDNERFNRAAAGEMVAIHNRWLADQQPLVFRRMDAERLRQERATALIDAEKRLNAARTALEMAEAECRHLSQLALAHPTGDSNA